MYLGEADPRMMPRRWSTVACRSDLTTNPGFFFLAHSVFPKQEISHKKSRFLVSLEALDFNPECELPPDLHHWSWQAASLFGHSMSFSPQSPHSLLFSTWAHFTCSLYISVPEVTEVHVWWPIPIERLLTSNVQMIFHNYRFEIFGGLEIPMYSAMPLPMSFPKLQIWDHDKHIPNGYVSPLNIRVISVTLEKYAECIWYIQIIFKIQTVHIAVKHSESRLIQKRSNCQSATGWG